MATPFSSGGQTRTNQYIRTFRFRYDEVMSAQRSSRSALLEATVSCLGRMPLEQLSARTLAQESGANLASIGYHYGSKDGLVTAAVVESLDRWLDSIGARLALVDPDTKPATRFHQAAAAVDRTRTEQDAVARSFVAALARGLHDDVVAGHLIEGFQHTRPRVAELLGLGADSEASDAGALVHAMFIGLLVQSLLSDELAMDADRLLAGLRRISDVLGPSDIGDSA